MVAVKGDAGKDRDNMDMEDTAANTAVEVAVGDAVEVSATADIATAGIAAVASSVASSAVADKLDLFAEAVAAKAGNRKSVVVVCLAAAAVSTAVKMCACGSK